MSFQSGTLINWMEFIINSKEWNLFWNDGMTLSITITQSGTVSLITGLESLNGILRQCHWLPRTLQLKTRHHRTENMLTSDIWHDIHLLCPVPASCIVTTQISKNILKQYRQPSHLCLIKSLSAVFSKLHSVFDISFCIPSVRSPRYRIPMECMAFDIQTPKTLAAWQISCLTAVLSACLIVSLPLILSSLYHRAKTGDGPKPKGSLTVTCLSIHLIWIRSLWACG